VLKNVAMLPEPSRSPMSGWPPGGQRDRHGDHDEPDEIGRDRSGKRSGPPCRPERIVRTQDQTEQEDRQAGREGEVRDVEREFDERLPTMQGKCSAAAHDQRDQQHRRRKEEQPDDERDLAERERVRVPTELEVDDEHLRRRVRSRHDGPMDTKRGIEAGQAADEQEVEAERGHRQHGDQEPDTRRTAEDGGQRATSDRGETRRMS
jgi:hypothetical protein